MVVYAKRSENIYDVYCECSVCSESGEVPLDPLKCGRDRFVVSVAIALREERDGFLDYIHYPQGVVGCMVASGRFRGTVMVSVNTCRSVCGRWLDEPCDVLRRVPARYPVTKHEFCEVCWEVTFQWQIVRSWDRWYYQCGGCLERGRE